MRSRRKRYLVPVAFLVRLFQERRFCAGSGDRKFLDNSGTVGSLNAIERNGDASEAASRRFGDEECNEEW